MDNVGPKQSPLKLKSEFNSILILNPITQSINQSIQCNSIQLITVRSIRVHQFKLISSIQSVQPIEFDDASSCLRFPPLAFQVCGMCVFCQENTKTKAKDMNIQLSFYTHMVTSMGQPTFHATNGIIQGLVFESWGTASGSRAPAAGWNNNDYNA